MVATPIYIPHNGAQGFSFHPHQHLLLFTFFKEIGSTPTMGIEFMTLRSRAACSTDRASQVPRCLFCYSCSLMGVKQNMLENDLRMA